MAQTVKILPAAQESCVQSLGREDPLEEEMAPHSSILAWRIPGTEEPGGLQSMGSQRVEQTPLSLHTFTLIGFNHNFILKYHSLSENIPFI